MIKISIHINGTRATVRQALGHAWEKVKKTARRVGSLTRQYGKPATLYALSLTILLTIGFYGYGAIRPPARPGPYAVLDGNTPSLSYDEAAALAIHLDHLADAYGDPPSHPTQSDLLKWASMIIPAYEYEGLVSRAHWPQELRFHLYPQGLRYFHVMGTSNCNDYAVITVRYANEHDVKSEHGNYLATLAHELGHLQQGAACMFRSSEFIENSAQITSWEVLAGLANYGNPEAARALVHELRSAAASAAYAAARAEGRIDDYEAMRAVISPGAVRLAAHEKAGRFWAGRQGQLTDILLLYNLQPMAKVMEAYHTGDPIYVAAAVDGTYGTDFYIDDLIYFLDHAEAILAQMQLDEARGAR